MSDHVIGLGRGARLENGILRFVDYDGTVTALEPILLDVDVSVEEYELDVENVESYDFDIDTVIKVTPIEGDMYEGPYVVDPEFEEQILATRNKTMSDDVTVHRIDVSTVENHAGGNTVYIGGII